MPVIPRSSEEMQKKLLLGNVDAGNGTLFGIPNLRQPSSDRLTLVISTGGSGASAIQMAIKTAEQKLTPDFKNYVKFIVVDSAKGELAELTKKGIDVINISTDGAQNRMALLGRPPFFRDFMCQDYDLNLIDNKGAGRDRTTGKLKLYDIDASHTDTNLGKLKDKITNLFNGPWFSSKDKHVDILILSGLSGGNGSGTFLDLAVWAKAACLHPENVDVYGYLMLPDTAAKFAGDVLGGFNSFKRNGFAALKELESFMSISAENQDREELFVNPQGEEVKISYDNKIYDYPILISGDYNKAVSMIAETIVNTISKSDGYDNQGLSVKFNQESFYGNLITIRQDRLTPGSLMNYGELKPDAFPEDSHMYSAMGYASASIPEKIVLPHLVSRVVSRMYTERIDGGMNDAQTVPFCSTTRRFTRIEFEAQMRKLLNLRQGDILNEKSLLQKVKQKMAAAVNMRDNNNLLDADMVKTGNVKAYLEGFHVDQVSQEAHTKFVKDLEDLYKELKDQAKIIMYTFGPRAIECLFSGIGNPDATGIPESFDDICMKRQIQEVASFFTGFQPAVYPGARDIGLLPAVFKGKMNEWKRDARRAAQNDVRYKMCEKMKGDNGGWNTEYVSKAYDFRDCCARFAQVLEMMSDYYKGAGNSLDADDYATFAETSGDPNGINLCSNLSIYNWVVGTVSSSANGININQAKQDLIDDFYARSGAWTSDDEGVARKAYDDVMSRICHLGIYSSDSNGIHLSIVDYFNEVLKDVPDAQQQQVINNTIDEIMGRLRTASTPMLNIRQGKLGPKNTIILVPSALKTCAYQGFIDQAFRRHNGKGDTFAYSDVVDSIVCYQASVANAICDLKDLDLWENAYEANATNSMHTNNGELFKLRLKTGLSQYKELTYRETCGKLGKKSQLKEEDTLLDPVLGTGLSWKNHESINLYRYGDDFAGDDNTTEARYRRNIFSKVFKLALDWKIIEMVETSPNVFTYWVNTLPRDWDNLSVDAYIGKSSNVDNGRYKRGQALFEYLLSQNPNTRYRTYRKKVMLYGCPVFDGNFDFNDAMEHLGWPRERAENTAKSYVMRILRKREALYLELRNTLFKFVGIENILLDEEKKLVDQKTRSKFCEYFLNGILLTDENKFTWSVRTGSVGDTEATTEIMSFSKLTVRKMSDFDQKTARSNMKLYLVYRKFRDLFKEGKIAFESTDQAQEDFLENIGEREYEILSGKQTRIMQDEIAVFDKVTDSNPDAVDALMNNCLMAETDEAIDFAEDVMMFYTKAKEAMEQQF